MNIINLSNASSLKTTVLHSSAQYASGSESSFVYAPAPEPQEKPDPNQHFQNLEELKVPEGADEEGARLIGSYNSALSWMKEAKTAAGGKGIGSFMSQSVEFDEGEGTKKATVNFNPPAANKQVKNSALLSKSGEIWGNSLGAQAPGMTTPPLVEYSYLFEEKDGKKYLRVNQSIQITTFKGPAGDFNFSKVDLSTGKVVEKFPN